MKISTLPAKGGGTRYLVMNDDGEIICSFDALEKAALVIRFLLGANLPEDDCSHAVDIMRIFDKDNKTWRADRDAKRAARRQAKQQPAEAPETPLEAPEQEVTADVKPEQA